MIADDVGDEGEASEGVAQVVLGQSHLEQSAQRQRHERSRRGGHRGSRFLDLTLRMTSLLLGSRILRLSPQNGLQGLGGLLSDGHELEFTPARPGGVHPETSQAKHLLDGPLKQLDRLDALKGHLKPLPLDDALLDHEHFPLDAVLEPEVIHQSIGPGEDQESGSTEEDVAQGVVAERNADEQRPRLLPKSPQELGGQDQDPEGVLAARLEEVHYPFPVRVSRTARRRSASSSSRPAILRLPLPPAVYSLRCFRPKTRAAGPWVNSRCWICP